MWLAFVVGSALCGCSSHTAPKQVAVQWQALLVYHPLWEVPEVRHDPRWQHRVSDVALPSSLRLPAVTLQPVLTPASERRRNQLVQSIARQQQELVARLQQMEVRRLQEATAQLRLQQQLKEEMALQEARLRAEQEVQEALQQHYLPQAESELRRHVLRRLLRLRPDLRDPLRARLEEVEARQQQLEEALRNELARIEAETTRRLRERQAQVQSEIQRQREELQQQSQQRLQAEQIRVSQMIRPFAGNGELLTFPPVTRQITATPRRPSPVATLPSPQIPPLVEQDVKQWVEAICRKHRWVPVWQPQPGLPDVTVHIAQEMQGTALWK